MSYTSPNGMPPRYADAAELYRRDNTRPDPPGIYLLPASTGTAPADINALTLDPARLQHPPVIRDPAPIDVFPELTRLLRLTWGLILTPLGLWIVVMLLRWRIRRIGFFPGAVAGLAGAALVTTSLYFYGRVSSHASLAGKVVIVLLAVAALYHAVRLWRQGKLVERVAAVATLVAIVIVAHYAMPILQWA